MPSLGAMLSAAILVAAAIVSPPHEAKAAPPQTGTAATGGDHHGGLTGKSRGVSSGDSNYAAQVGAPDTVSRAPRDCSAASRQSAGQNGARPVTGKDVSQACGGGGPIGGR